MSIEIPRIEYNGINMPVSDVPDALSRAFLGYGHFPADVAHRKVITVTGRTWAHTPDTCLTDEYRGEWLNEDILVCTGCGLDCT